MAKEKTKEAVVEEINYREELKKVSAQLENNNTSIALCKKLIEGGVIRIVDPTDQSEAPPALTVNGDIVNQVLLPIIRLSEAKKEQLLSIKEQVLNAIAAELVPVEEKNGNKNSDTIKK